MGWHTIVPAGEWERTELVGLAKRTLLAAIAAAGLWWLPCAEAVTADGLLVWNGNVAGPHLDIIGDEAGGDLKPIRIMAARNGVFSGKLVLCSTAPIKGASAKIGDLVTADGKAKIPAAQVQVRLATGYIKSGWLVQSRAGSTFDVLNEGMVDETKPLPPIRDYDKKYHPWAKTGRSYLPVWVTVHVPPAAAEGEYTGKLTVTADGKTIEAPVALTVIPYALPNPAEFRTWIETIQSPDTLAAEYKVPLWSERHWQLIEKSLDYGAMVGNKTVYIPLIAETNLGNAQSMVRWFKDGQRYKFDTSIAEKYLDLQIKVQGKPAVVCFVLWDAYLEGPRMGDDSAEVIAARKALEGKGPEVTTIGEDGKTPEKLPLPPRTEQAGRDLWPPLLLQLRDMLKKRGLEKCMFFGIACDTAPPEAVTKMVNEALPGSPWVIHAHSFYGGKDKQANFQYAAFVWGVDGFCDGRKGWLKPFILTQFLRNMTDNWPITTYRIAPEVNITGGQRGLGRMGLDYWSVLRNSRGERAGQVWQRYPKAYWRNLNITLSLLAPGPDGPIATARFEMLREGVQECEARIFIQTAIDGGKLPADLADACKKVLAERDEFLRKVAIVKPQGRPWFDAMNPSDEAYNLYATGWQEQAEKLYKAAAMISRAQAQ
ncbi:MAG: glycoside hydrolase domain-containing protein [Phycisphaerae bacterium]